MNNKTLLVVMPLYNSENTVAAAIESILSQTYKNIRLVIVEDCSDDSSLEIAKAYLSDPRVSLYKNNKNMGAYYCRNFGLYANKSSRWGFFTTHDADDISFEDRYSILIKSLNQKVSALAVHDKFERVNYFTNKTISVSLTMAHAILKRIVFDFAGYFETTRFGADWEHWARVVAYGRLHGYSTISVNEVLGISYIHDKNLTVQIPLGSYKRINYVSASKANIRKMIDMDNFYREFGIEETVTGRVE